MASGGPDLGQKKCHAQNTPIGDNLIQIQIRIHHMEFIIMVNDNGSDNFWFQFSSQTGDAECEYYDIFVSIDFAPLASERPDFGQKEMPHPDCTNRQRQI